MRILITVLLGITFSSQLSYNQEHNIPALIEKGEFDPSSLLWYNKPADAWEEALPVGNGRIGAMVFGKTEEERIQFNEETYWSGGPYSTVVEGGHTILPEIQRLVFEEKFLEAHNLFGRHLMGYPVEQQKYQCLANLHIFLEDRGEITNYKRWLDLESGIAGVEYSASGIKYSREVFASAPYQVIVVRITADKPGSVSFKANLRGVRNQAHSNYATDYMRMDPYGKDGLVVTGKSADYMGIEGKIRYEARVKAIPVNGSIIVDGTDLIVKDADTVTLYFAAATNFVNYNNVSGNQHLRVNEVFKAIDTLGFEKIMKETIDDHSSLFNRVKINLPVVVNSYLPTDQRMALLENEEDPALAALAYQFGRYVLIASSRPGTQPANLQGIWNEDMNPSWDSKYTTNINTEMNYWPVESGNLSECAEPLIKMIQELTDQGSLVASEHYGSRGWVFHQNTDLWRVAAPMDGPTWGTFTTGGAWLTTHLWEHYLYTMDKDYLAEVYPVIKGSVQFFMDFLVEHPNGKWLVTNPSTSPENFPASPGNERYFDEVTSGYRPGTTICSGSSIDMQILTDLFGYYTEAAAILGTDHDFAAKVRNARSRLVPPQIGKDGSLQEWTDDWDQLEKEHRHFSHMYGLYPGNVISPARTPGLIDACKAVLEQRGDQGTGFSRGWKMALWARLYDGERANKIFRGYIKEQAYDQLFAKCFTPLQVDGTLGVTAAITEMLMQSYEGVIHLLPALPESWKDGAFIGVCARGAFELKMSWRNSTITELELFSGAGEKCRLKNIQKPEIRYGRKKVEFITCDDGTIEFDTRPGVNYIIKVVDAKK
ncbi:MAG TPA: glycoside hydrolase family 95 protein [Bacteroidales bacterium]|nr:glycoside hydrolase family 95 protein [Bacteroidales bacterium]